MTGTGDLQGDAPTEPAALDAARETGAPRREVGDGVLEVVAHQRDLVMLRPSVGGMDSQLRGTAPEDEPAGVGVDVRPPEDIAEERPRRVGIVRVDQDVHPGDHVGRDYAPQFAGVPDLGEDVAAAQQRG